MKGIENMRIKSVLLGIFATVLTVFFATPAISAPGPGMDIQFTTGTTTWREPVKIAYGAGYSIPTQFSDVFELYNSATGVALPSTLTSSGVYAGARSWTNIDPSTTKYRLKNSGTSWGGATDISYMFSNATALKSIELPADWGNARNVSGLFHYCTNLESITYDGYTGSENVILPPNWGTVTNASFMFEQAKSLDSILLPTTWGNITHIDGMFDNTHALTSLKYNGYAASGSAFPVSWGNITHARRLFGTESDWMGEPHTRIESLTLPSTWANMIDVTGMLQETYSLKTIKYHGYNGTANVLPTSWGNVTLATDFMHATTSLPSIVIPATWGNNMTDLSNFISSSAITSIKIHGYNGSENLLPASWNNVTILDGMFWSSPYLESIVLPESWGNVTNTRTMFQSAGALKFITIPKISEWSGISDSTYMFDRTGFWQKGDGIPRDLNNDGQFISLMSPENTVFPRESWKIGIGLDGLCPYESTPGWTNESSANSCKQTLAIALENHSFIPNQYRYCSSGKLTQRSTYGEWDPNQMTLQSCDFSEYDISFNTSSYTDYYNAFSGTFELYNSTTDVALTLGSDIDMGVPLWTGINSNTKYRFSDGLKKWNGRTYTDTMFESSSLLSIELPDRWDSITSTTGMFAGANQLTSVILPTNWENVTETRFMFYNTSLQSLQTYASASATRQPNHLPNSWGNITNIEEMFTSNDELTVAHLPNSWNAITDASDLFENSTKLNNVKIPTTWGSISSANRAKMFLNTDFMCYSNATIDGTSAQSRASQEFPNPPFLANGNTGANIGLTNLPPCETSITCNPGHYLPAGSLACVICPPGDYCPNTTTHDYDSLNPVGPATELGRYDCPTIYIDNPTSGQDAITDCYVTTDTGQYIKTANDEFQTTCPARSYCPSDDINYGSTGNLQTCPALTSGWLDDTISGANCAQTKSFTNDADTNAELIELGFEHCKTGTFAQTADYGDAWGATTVINCEFDKYDIAFNADTNGTNQFNAIFELLDTSDNVIPTSGNAANADNYRFNDAYKQWNGANYNALFNGITQLTRVTIPEFNSTGTGKTTNSMFKGATSVNSVTLPRTWGNVEQAYEMFFGAASLPNIATYASPTSAPAANHLPSDWGNMKNTSYMFSGATGLTSAALPEQWGPVHTHIIRMFSDTSNLNVAVLPDDWGILTHAYGIFENATSLSSIVLPNNWGSTISTANRGAMFLNTDFVCYGDAIVNGTSAQSPAARQFPNPPFLANGNTGANIGLTDLPPCSTTITCEAGDYIAANTTTCTVCPLGDYCPDETTYTYTYDNPVGPTSDMGRYDCENGYTDNEYTGRWSRAQCQILATAGKYVATAGDGLTTCLGDDYCPGGEKFFFETGAGGQITGGNTQCPSGYDYNTEPGKSLATQCQARTTAGNYIATSNDSTQTICPAYDYCEGGDIINYGSTGGNDNCPTIYVDNPATGQDAETDCYVTTDNGQYIKTANDGFQTTCPANSNCPSGNINYGNTGIIETCPATTDGWSNDTISGADCAQTKTFTNDATTNTELNTLGFEHCKTGTFVQTAGFDEAWGATTVINCDFDTYDIAFNATTSITTAFNNIFELLDSSDAITTTATDADNYRFKDAYKKWNGSNYASLFQNVTQLTRVTLPEFDSTGTGKTTNNMFSGAIGLTSVILPNDWGNVTSTAYMFFNADALTSVTLPDDWGNITTTNSMFRYMDNLTSVQLPRTWGNSLTNIAYMFDGCASLTNFGTYSSETGALENNKLPQSWNNITIVGYLFRNAIGLTSVTLPDSWHGVQETLFMFAGATSLTSVVLPEFWADVFNAKDMFNGATNLTNIVLPKGWEGIITSERRDMFANTGFLCYSDSDTSLGGNFARSRASTEFPNPPFLTEGNTGADIGLGDLPTCEASITCNPGFYIKAGTLFCSDCPGDSYCPDTTTYDYDFDNTGPAADMGKEPCPTDYLDNTDLNKIAENQCQIQTTGGYYIATAKSGTEIICPSTSYCEAGLIDFGSIGNRTLCPTISDAESGESITLRTSGLGGEGADNANDCGRTLNVGLNPVYQIFLKSGTLPAGPVLVVEDDFGEQYYGKMSTDQSKSRLKLNYQGTQYSVHTDN